MLNVYESVEANVRKSWLVIAGFVAFVFVSAICIAKGLGAYYGYQTSGLELSGLALVIAGVSSFVSYYFSDRIILTLSGAKPANRRTDFLFYTVTENLCLAANLPLPKLFTVDDTAMNAFATGRDPDHAVVCVTTGLLSRLNRTELEGVIGHELSHVANYDTRLMSIVTVLVGLVTLLGDWLIRASWYGRAGRSRDSDRSGGGLLILLGMLFAVLSPIVAKLIQLAISRRREFLADAQSVKITRQPSGLISALKKLGTDQEPLEVANKATAHLFIVNPLRNLPAGRQGRSDTIGWFASLFNTHPPLTERITALSQMV